MEEEQTEPATTGENSSRVSLGDRVQPSPNVLAKRAQNEIVLVHLQTSQIYELNRTGSALWGLVEHGLTRGEIEEQLALEFEVDRDQLASEIEELLGTLAAEDLIQPG